MHNIAILASGSGSNAENIARHFNRPGSPVHVAIVLSNRATAAVHERMLALGVETATFANDVWDNNPQTIIDELRRRDIDMVVLAGFLRKIHTDLVHAYRGRMLNIHPSLLPAYGGKGMYGRRIHEAVLAAGEIQTGVTVHLVSEEMDEGQIILQEPLAINPGETVDTLESRIHDLEFDLYPRAITTILQSLTH